MGLIAVLAAALAAWCATAIAVGVELGGWRLAYGLALVPGTVASIRRPNRWPNRWPKRWPNRSVPRWVVRSLIGGAAVASIALVRAGTPVLALLAPLPMAAPLLSLLWPRPGPLRASVVLSGTSLVVPTNSLSLHPALVLGVVAGSAVALTATSRLSHDLLRRTTKAVPGRERRTLTAASVVLAVAVIGGLLASVLLPPTPSFGTGSSQTAGEGRSGGDGITSGEKAVPPGAGTVAPADLAFQDRYDTSRPSPDGDATLLRVLADRPEVWRTQTFDEWDGRAWGQSQEGKHRRSVSPSLIDPRPNGIWSWDPSVLSDEPEGEHSIPPSVRTELLRQRFTVEAPYMDVMAAAARPMQVKATPRELYRDGPEAIRTHPPLGRGARYIVVSMRSLLTEEDLRASATRSAPASSAPPDADPYLRLPGISDRVRRLASDITAGAPTTYDKAKAVERWMAANVQLETTRQAVPDGADVVDTVLFVNRSGSSDRLATAMAVLLRAEGIPTRLGIGFLPGRRSPFGGDFVVRASDAHAWVEVSFGALGWQRFDPSGRIDEAQRADAPLARLLRLLRQLAPILAIAVGAAATYVLWRWMVRRRHERSQPWVHRYWTQLVKAGSARGRPRRPSDTPAEYTAALAGSVLPDDRLKDVGAIVTDAAFSGRELPPETTSWAEEGLGEAVRAARRERRRSLVRRRSRHPPPLEDVRR